MECSLLLVGSTVGNHNLWATQQAPRESGEGEGLTREGGEGPQLPRPTVASRSELGWDGEEGWLRSCQGGRVSQSARWVQQRQTGGRGGPQRPKARSRAECTKRGQGRLARAGLTSTGPGLPLGSFDQSAWLPKGHGHGGVSSEVPRPRLCRLQAEASGTEVYLCRSRGPERTDTAPGRMWVPAPPLPPKPQCSHHPSCTGSRPWTGSGPGCPLSLPHQEHRTGNW